MRGGALGPGSVDDLVSLMDVGPTVLEAGERYDLERDPHELRNLWGESASAMLKGEMLNKLLGWLATSTYYNAGYRRDRSRSYAMR